MTPADAILALLAAIIGGTVARARFGPQARFAAVLFPSMDVRNDTWGLGHYGAPRAGGRTHRGTDFVCRPGQAVFSPITGTLQRIAYPYADDLRFQGCAITGEGPDAGYAVKMFYMVPDGPIPRAVKAGERIGYCQAISEKYDAQMTDHLHVEVTHHGVQVDPLPLFTPEPPLA